MDSTNDYPADYDLELGRILRERLKLLHAKGAVTRAKDVREALERLYEDNFGRCMTCAIRIPYAEMLADPAASECAACAAHLKVRAA